MYKKLRKLCAWALAVVTVLTIIPSSGMVMADTEPANAKEVEQGTVYFKVPNVDSQIVVSTEDGSKQTITVSDGKTTLTDKDGNTSDAVIENGYCLELTEDVGTVISTEVIASDGYEVGTYHILSDTGDEIENKSLSSDNKYDLTVSENVQVVEVVLNEVETQSETTEETEETEVVEEPEEPTEIEEVTEEVTEPVEEIIEESRESNESVTETSPAINSLSASARAYNIFDHIGQTVNVQTWHQSQDTDSYKISWVNSNGVVKHRSKQGRLGVVSKLQPGTYNDDYLLQVMWCGDADISMRTGTRVVRDLSTYYYTGYTQTKLKQAAALFYWWDLHYGDEVSSFQNYYVKQAIVWWIKGSSESGKQGNTPYANWNNTSLRAKQKELWSTGLSWAKSNYQYFAVKAVLLTGENQPLFTMTYTYEPTGKAYLEKSSNNSTLTSGNGNYSLEGEKRGMYIYTPLHLVFHTYSIFKIFSLIIYPK